MHSHSINALLLLFLAVGIVKGQGSIQGQVVTGDGPLAYANVLLKSGIDSALVLGDLSDEHGQFLLEDIEAGEYVLTISLLGYTDHHLKLSMENAGYVRLDNILVEESITDLDAVTVTAKKQLFEQKIDRLVVNVEGSITAAGTTALEVLERSPGVIVNRQSSGISIAGKEGVVVMINGKINRMPLQAVVQMLDGMPSSNIEKIELITTPPADFDAEGNAGFINLVLKESNDQGWNGSYAFAGGVGRGTNSSASLNFNYRRNKVNFFGNYSFSRRAQQQLFQVDRQVMIQDETVRTTSSMFRDPIQRNHNVRLGLDYDISGRTVLGVLLTSYDNRWSMDARTEASILSDKVPDTLLTIQLDEVNHWKHIGGNVNLQHNFEEGASLSVDLDYLKYDNANPSNYFNRYADIQDLVFFNNETFSGKNTPIDVAVGKLDYNKKWSDRVNMQAGLKATVSRFENDVTVSYSESGVTSLDPELTARYELDESITAAYSAFDINLDDKSDMKLGLRYEYTNTTLGTRERPDIVDRKYGRFFPSFFVNRNFNDHNSANISYSRRINRPAFNDLAPFVIFFDPYTFISGNAALQPSISNSVKMDYRHKSALFSLQYTVEDSAISRFQVEVIEGTNKQIYASSNMKNLKTAALTVAFPITVTDWWNMQQNLIGSWQEVNAYYDDNLVRLRTQNFRIVWIHNFKLPKDFSAELVGFYTSRALSGAVYALPMRAVNFGFQKRLGENNGTLRFGIDDIFNSLKFRSEINLPEYNVISNVDLDWSQRTFKLSYSRNFGNNKLKAARKRTTGSEEERSRVTQ